MGQETIVLASQTSPLARCQKSKHGPRIGFVTNGHRLMSSGSNVGTVKILKERGCVELLYSITIEYPLPPHISFRVRRDLKHG